jgi:hypothetical protein
MAWRDYSGSLRRDAERRRAGQCGGAAKLTVSALMRRRP